MGTLLIVDDEQKLRSLLSRLLKEEGFEVLTAGDMRSAIKKLESHAEIDVVLSDVKLPDGDGVDFIRRVKLRFPEKELVLYTAYGTVADGIRAMKNGAFDYVLKGDDDEKIVPLLMRAMEKAQLRRRVIQLEHRVSRLYSFANIIAESPVMRAAVELAQRVAPTDAGVLLLGETGSGKEVFAQAIHEASTRAQRNFVALNCSAFGKDLLESELFGHTTGAFTGASTAKKGIVEEASGGTLFLDEVSEMPLELQAKLLRVLETHEFYKLGESTPTRVDFRLIAASNRDLKAESEAKQFRADLYYRLNVFEIVLPPLRQRHADIPMLLRDFVSHFCLKTNKTRLSIDASFIQALTQYRWPGNVRELKNVVERAVILCDSDCLTERDLPVDVRLAHDRIDDVKQDLATVEKNHILKILAQCSGNKSEAARILGIGLTTLYRKLEEFA